MYYIYGKKKDADKYRLVNVNYICENNTPCFELRRMRATIIATWEKAERACFEMENEFKDYFFEARKA